MKNFLERWFFVKPQLSEEQAARIDQWNALPDAEGTRIVVVDVETTGLDLVRDTLISIGAVAVVNGRIALGDSFSVVLQQDIVSRHENILIHGISGEAQRAGMPPADALLDFLEYLGKSPLAAFHVAFDETMIRRAMRSYLGFSFRHRWLDMAYVLPALWPERRLRTLDEWAEHFFIHNDARHNALADALATAQLLLVAQKVREMDYDRLRGVERRYRSALENTS
jgi:DNA polymerase III subunit epsilon